MDRIGEPGIGPYGPLRGVKGTIPVTVAVTASESSGPGAARDSPVVVPPEAEIIPTGGTLEVAPTGRFNGKNGRDRLEKARKLCFVSCLRWLVRQPSEKICIACTFLIRLDNFDVFCKMLNTCI